MALLAKLQRYNRWQYIAALLVCSVFLAVCYSRCLTISIIGHLQVLPVLFVISLPVFLYTRWVYYHQKRHCIADKEIEQLLWIFLGGGFVNTALAIVAQLGLSLILARLCFYDQWSSIKDQLNKSFHPAVSSQSGLKKHVKLGEVLMKLEVDKSLGYFLFLFGVAYIVAGLVEEFLKYWIVQGSCKCRSPKSSSCIRRLFACCKGRNVSLPAFTTLKQRQQRRDARKGMVCHPSRLLFSQRPPTTNAFVVFLAVVAGALGFSVMENMGFAFGAPTFREKVESAVLRCIMSTPLHCVCGGITGIRMAERVLASRLGTSEQRGINALKADLGRWSTKLAILLPAIAIHGTFDMLLLLLMVFVSDAREAEHPILYQVVIPTLISLVILIPSLMFLRRKLVTLEAKINETHYMHVAVDLESGERLKAVNGGIDLEEDDEEDDSEAEEERAVQEGNRKVRSVFEI